MRIRVYTAADRRAVSAIDAHQIIDSVAVLTASATTIEWVAAALEAPRLKSHQISDYLAEPDPQWSEGFVAELDGKVVAFGAVGFESWNRRAVLAHLYVDASARRRGIARQLLDAVVARARAEGSRQLWLETQDTNVPAIEAYEHLGFRIVGFDRSLYENPPDAETAVFLSLDLERPDAR